MTDDKTISRRGRLNDVLITKLQNFYGLAIRRKAQKTVEEGKEV